MTVPATRRATATLPIDTRLPDVCVAEWFGAHFSALHPRLQELHRVGGQLRGTVRIDIGKGIAGWIGRRLARRLGIPQNTRDCGFTVTISHHDGELHWSREFAGGSRMHSVFRPIGHWPDGYWIERSGPFELRLGVDVIDGGWYWRLRAARLAGLPLPLAFLPTTRAHKRIRNDRYCFLVELSLPLLGMILSYAGDLDLVDSGVAATLANSVQA
ncbi:MAG: DUF4166 domain-containing protein [Tahibacter sp.]